MNRTKNVAMTLEIYQNPVMMSRRQRRAATSIRAPRAPAPAGAEAGHAAGANPPAADPVPAAGAQQPPPEERTDEDDADMENSAEGEKRKDDQQSGGKDKKARTDGNVDPSGGSGAAGELDPEADVKAGTDADT